MRICRQLQHIDRVENADVAGTRDPCDTPNLSESLTYAKPTARLRAFVD